MPFAGEWGWSRDGCIRWGGGKGRGSFGVNLERLIVTKGILCVRVATYSSQISLGCLVFFEKKKSGSMS